MDSDRKFLFYVIFLLFSIVLVGFWSVCAGQVKLPLSSIIDVFLGKGNSLIRTIVLDIRLPRFLLSASVGGMLALSGLSLQTLFRNPLVDPYFLGVSSAAEFGVTVAILMGVNASVFGISFASLFAFVSALCLIFLLIRISSSLGVESSKAAIVLIGIAISYVFSAANNLIALYKKDLFLQTTFWSMKGFNNVSISQFYFSFPFLVIGFLILFANAKKMNIYLSSDLTAHSLGIDIKKFTVLMLTVSALLTSVSVVVSGTIVFVGLFIPHIGRLLVGDERKKLVVITVLLGLFLLPLFDLVSRTVLPGQEIPVNTIVSAIGAPFFLYLFLRRKNGIH
ncbi:MAG: iron ABC transporter permease [Caldisericaceae bacterium]|nr:iron ABC transporter permease [Caldisericaceae bacterium]